MGLPIDADAPGSTSNILQATPTVNQDTDISTGAQDNAFVICSSTTKIEINAAV